MARSARSIHERQLAYAPEHHTSYTAKGRIVEGSDVLVKMASVGLMASGGAGYIGGRAMVKPVVSRMTRGRFSKSGARAAVKTVEKAYVKRKFGQAKFSLGAAVHYRHESNR
jgi:hypothetical protein